MMVAAVAVAGAGSSRCQVPKSVSAAGRWDRLRQVATCGVAVMRALGRAAVTAMRGGLGGG